MRLIPGRTKVKIELFKGVTLADVGVGLVGVLLITFCLASSLPAKWVITAIILSIFVPLLFRIDDDPMYLFLWHMIRYKAYPRRFVKSDDSGAEASNEDQEDETETEEDKERLKELIKEENKILKSKTATKEEKDAVWLARAERSAEKKKAKESKKDEKFDTLEDFMPFTDIKDGYIEYNGEYYGSVIEVDPVEFRFFSKYRRNNSIESCFGKVLRGMQGDYGANIVKVQRPIIYDEYLDAEYDKLDQLKASYESGLFTEAELKSRVEIQYDRINEVRELCNEDKVIEPFYYLVLFENDKRRLDVITRQAIMSLEQGELTVKRLNTKELAVFLKYTNGVDFDEKEINRLPEEEWAKWAMPDSLKINMRNVVVDGIITHNLRVISYPTVVGDAWLAGVMSFPSTKVVVKVTPMDNGKAIKAIDRSLSELRGQYMTTSLDSKVIELQEHIDTLSSLLVTLQQENEALMNVNIYITAYDASATAENPLYNENFKTVMPYVADMKKTVRRSWNESGMRVTGMDFLQIQSFIGSQVSNYDPLVKEARGIPTNTIAGMYPWIFAHISDKGGIKLGSSQGVPVFIDFFRRDSERVNSNMVIVGKSGSGKSYATKSLLTNLASEDAKIFILDPENEYSELANTLHGKVINVGNATYGRLNPFHIITALDDDEAGTDGGGPGGSFATHLQFLEEFFRQILPDIDKDALEYLNSLVERMYLNFGITPETDLSGFDAEDYPIFDDLYDVVLQEFERTNNEYLRQLLRSLVNYISKFSTGGRNANIWNGPSTITTDENFSVFNFQSMLANRNTTIANAQMLLVLKYIDNEIIKNRDYNIKYNLKRKIVVVIDEAHVFIDTKFPVALDFMYQLAKRIRKYNGMQIVITQNIKDFVGSEEIARKSSAIINACQYSFVFSLAPNDMDDLCKLYEKAGGINEREQEDIVGAKRGEVFTIMSPTSRSSFMIEVPDSFVDMFENQDFQTNYFFGDEGVTNWEDFVADSRETHDVNYEERKASESEKVEKQEKKSSFTFSEISVDEALELERESSDDNEIRLEETAKSPRQEERRNSFDKLMEAEEAVNRKEYEMAMGRFGSINLAEVSEDEFDNDADEISFEDISLNDNVKAGASKAKEKGSVYSEEELEMKLSDFRESIRKEMEDELVERLKWISIGAGINQGQAVASASGAVSYDTNRMSAPTAFADNSSTQDSSYIDDDDDFITSMFSDEDDYLTSPNTNATEDSKPSDDHSLEDDSSNDDEFDFDFDTLDESLDSSRSDDEHSSDSSDYDFDSDSSDDEFDFDFDTDDSSDEFDFDFGSTDDSDDDEFSYSSDDDIDDLFSDDESEEYEPAPFLFAELLAEAAEEYANMGIEERMAEMGEDVIEVTVEELAAYIKEQRKKK
ncbi:MAG: DUF87 domain-containing protein [Lachnospiraceae bacterium]|nr:DUF87 domain-containing protein [Lachnospiraceae bacterium]